MHLLEEEIEHFVVLGVAEEIGQRLDDCAADAVDGRED